MRSGRARWAARAQPADRGASSRAAGKWSSRYDHLREATREGIIAVRDAVTGKQCESRIVALRSLFRHAGGRGVTQVVPGTRDGVLVHFVDGRQETFDLVVAADGAWSRVRPAVSPVTPHYTGVTYVETSLDGVDTRHPDLARLIGDGSVAVYGVNRALVAQRNSGGHVKVYAQFRAPLDWHTNLDLADAEAVRSSLLALFDGWAAPVLDLLRHGTAFVQVGEVLDDEGHMVPRAGRGCRASRRAGGTA